MDTASPHASVMMSVYNAQDTLERAVRSILSQTFENFEFIIIDDGSTDNTTQILNSFDDPRISVIHQTNQGLAKALNKGIAEAQGTYIVRQDADDISLPTRIKKQVRVLNENSHIDVVGCYFQVLDEKEGPIIVKPFTLNPFIQNPFMHGSVTFRKEVFVNAGGYDERLEFGQDWDLWMRIYRKNNFFIIKETLAILRESRNKNIMKLFIYPEYNELIWRMNQVSSSDRDIELEKGLKKIDKLKTEVNNLLERGALDEDEWLKSRYHFMWAGRYIANGQTKKARQHYNLVSIKKRKFREKFKYLLTYLPDNLSVCIFRLCLFLKILTKMFTMRLFRNIGR